MLKLIGNPYFPILMNIDVTDPNNALYLENVINNRDIRVKMFRYFYLRKKGRCGISHFQAFCADNTDDANKLMRLMRQSQQLRVNVLQINPRDHPDNYVSKKNQRDLQKYGFKGNELYVVLQLTWFSIVFFLQDTLRICLAPLILSRHTCAKITAFKTFRCSMRKRKKMLRRSWITSSSE